MRVAALFLLAAISLSGCQSDGACTRDTDCAAAEACTARACVAKLGSVPMELGVELEPPPDSIHARRDYPMVSFAADPVALELDGKVEVRAQVTSPLGVSLERSSSVRAVLDVPSLLPGRPPQSFEVDAANKGAALPYDLGVVVPAGLLGRPARLTVAPLAPLDLWLCPWQLDVVVAAAAQITLPALTDSVLIEGSVLTTTAPGAPVPVHEARLFADDGLLSNIARSGADGKFTLRAQKSQLEGRGDARVEVTLADATSANAGAIVLSVPYTGQTQLGVLKIPPAPEPMLFKVPVMRDSDGKPVAGATVRFVYRLDGASAGMARYIRVGQTGPDGVATVPLLLGSGASTRTYAVSVEPPADTEVGALCVPSYAVGAGTAGAFGAALRLPAKAILEGQIHRAGGAVAAGMRVHAVRLGAGDDEGCGPPADSAAEATADRDGRYRLRLAPGDYHVDFEPPVETALPRHQVPMVAVAGSTHLDVSLPEGLLVEGRVTAAGGVPLVMAGRTEVRLFLTGASADGRVLGSALTGPEGQFRVVVPRPGP
jgi:hypothetical protein